MPVTPEAVELIARASGGIPRVINAICDNALLLIFGRGLSAVTEKDVTDACRDLDILTMIAPEPAPAALLPHSGSNGNGHGNGAPASQVLQLNAPPPEVAEFSSLRTLDGYNPARKRSLWSRLFAKNGAAQ